LQCNLWDPVEQRHDNEVIDAAKQAIAKFRAEHPDVDDEALKVDLPAPVAIPPPPGQPARPLHAVPAAQMEGQPMEMQAARARAIARAHMDLRAAQAAMQQAMGGMGRPPANPPAYMMHMWQVMEPPLPPPLPPLQGRHPVWPPVAAAPRRRRR
jgi:E3 ubiquitin-protein ligase RNF216